MIKGFKIRIYPNKQQKILIEKHFGCCRFIYNYMVEMQTENYKKGNKYIKKYDMIRSLTPLKRQEDYLWLREVSGTSLQIVCADVNESFINFFRKNSGYPKYKSKKASKKIYPVCVNRFYFKDSRHAQIQKLGVVKCKTDFKLPIGRNKFIDVRLSKEINKYFLSFSVECENQARELNDYSLGIDLGIKKLAVVSYGDNSLEFYNINKTKKMKQLNKQLKTLQKSIARKYEQNKQNGKYIKTKNIIKAEKKSYKIYRKISNIRNNYLHQVTHQLVELLPKRIVMEDLNVRGMMKNKHLTKAINEQNFCKFKDYMKYKCKWSGVEFVEVGRFYPSSKMCSCCGEIKKDLKLKDRIYRCKCGLEIDRDLNAAINLKNYIA